MEGACRSQRPATPGRQLEEARTPVRGIGPALQVAASGHVIDHLSCALLADPQAFRQGARRERRGVQSAEDVAVRPGEVVEAPLAEVLVELADELLVGQGEQDAEVGINHARSI
jgi:hypothetical protein